MPASTPKRPSEETQSIAAALRKAIADLGMTQQEVADRAQMSRNMVHQLCSGKVAFPVDRAPDLALALKIPLESMMYKADWEDPFKRASAQLALLGPAERGAVLTLIENLLPRRS